MKRKNFNEASFESTCLKTFKKFSISDPPPSAVPPPPPPASESSSLPSENPYTFANPRQQNFSIPSSMLYYMISKAETREIYQKLMMSCKKFFAQNQVIPAWDCYFNEGDPRWTAYWDQANFSNKKILDLEKNVSKFLLWGRLDVQSQQDANLIKTSIPHIYRFELSHLCLLHQNISWNEFELLTMHGEIKRLNFVNVEIKDDGSDSMITFDRILEKLPHVYLFEFSFSKTSPIFLPETTKKIVDILLNHKELVTFSLSEIPETFVFEPFAAFLTQNHKLKISLKFASLISDTFEETLQNFVNGFLQSRPGRLPLIEFPGQDRHTFLIMRKMFTQNIIW